MPDKQTLSDQSTSVEPNVILTLTLTQADELWALLGDRPHWEDWSLQIRTNLKDRLDEVSDRSRS